jgi:hypothetical protein
MAKALSLEIGRLDVFKGRTDSQASETARNTYIPGC